MTIQASEGVLDVLDESGGAYVGHWRFENATGIVYYGSWGPLCEAYRRIHGGIWVEAQIWPGIGREERFEAHSGDRHPEFPDLPMDVADWSEATSTELRAIYWACRQDPATARDFMRAVF